MTGASWAISLVPGCSGSVLALDWALEAMEPGAGAPRSSHLRSHRGGSGIFHVDDFSVVPQATLTLETFLTREAFDLPTGRFRPGISDPGYALDVVANWSTAFLPHRQLNLEATEGAALGGGLFVTTSFSGVGPGLGDL